MNYNIKKLFKELITSPTSPTTSPTTPDIKKDKRIKCIHQGILDINRCSLVNSNCNRVGDDGYDDDKCKLAWGNNIEQQHTNINNSINNRYYLNRIQAAAEIRKKEWILKYLPDNNRTNSDIPDDISNILETEYTGLNTSYYDVIVDLINNHATILYIYKNIFFDELEFILIDKDKYIEFMKKIFIYTPILDNVFPSTPPVTYRFDKWITQNDEIILIKELIAKRNSDHSDPSDKYNSLNTIIRKAISFYKKYYLKNKDLPTILEWLCDGYNITLMNRIIDHNVPTPLCTCLFQKIFKLTNDDLDDSILIISKYNTIITSSSTSDRKFQLNNFIVSGLYPDGATTTVDKQTKLKNIFKTIATLPYGDRLNRPNDDIEMIILTKEIVQDLFNNIEYYGGVNKKRIKDFINVLWKNTVGDELNIENLLSESIIKEEYNKILAKISTEESELLRLSWNLQNMDLIKKYNPDSSIMPSKYKLELAGTYHGAFPFIAPLQKATFLIKNNGDVNKISAFYRILNNEEMHTTMSDLIQIINFYIEYITKTKTNPDHPNKTNITVNVTPKNTLNELNRIKKTIADITDYELKLKSYFEYARKLMITSGSTTAGVTINKIYQEQDILQNITDMIQAPTKRELTQQIKARLKTYESLHDGLGEILTILKKDVHFQDFQKIVYQHYFGIYT